jgi:hypothetical protein
MFDRIVDGVWTTARKQRFWGLECGTRMTVVRLGNGSLFVHCPVALDPATRTAVDALGQVAAVVAPSLFHHLYVGEWQKAYPDAQFFGCPGLDKKRTDLRWNGILGDDAHALWSEDLDQVNFGARFEREIVFFHRKSKTMICADALLNLSKHPSRITRASAFLMGNTKPGKGYLEYVAVRDWKAGRVQVDRMLRWDTDKIVLAHGGLVDSNGREVLRHAYAWL